MRKKFRIALAGNPNCGKTSIFNQLTGTRQHTGNYPGVTVESKRGIFTLGEREIELIDLPGVYSLSSSSPEEAIAFEELITPGIDLIINVIDSSLPRRSFYLTTQLAELHIPMLLAFNMSDEADKKGLSFKISELEKYFGARIVRTMGTRESGISELRRVLAEELEHLEEHDTPMLNYGDDVNDAIAVLAQAIEERKIARLAHIPARFFAIKLLEGDASVSKIAELQGLEELVSEQIRHLNARHAINPETFMADCRYALISGACRSTVLVSHERRREISERIDSVMTNKYVALPLFLLIMYLTFWFTFTCAAPMMVGIDSAFVALSNAIQAVWPQGRWQFAEALLVDGVIGGVGGVLSFLPNILMLFLAIAFLEDSGYMARAAFVMDGLMRRFGLHGKSFIPLVLGFGCTVPAVLATRSIESVKDRTTTIMVLPFMSCGARLPIYSLFIPAFFLPQHQTFTLWSIYIIGVLVAMLAARLMKKTLFKGDGEVYLLELPPYRMPTVKSMLIHVWERTKMYLSKAGTVILLASVILFLANTFPRKQSFARDYAAEKAVLQQQGDLDEQVRQTGLRQLELEQQAEAMAYTVTGRVGQILAPLFRPIGFDWKVSTSLIGAAAAKELFVSQLGILYAVEDTSEESLPLRQHLQRNYTPLQAFCIMLFCLLTMPCVATFAVVRRELNSWSMAIAQSVGMFLVAYILTFIVYQTGMLLKIGQTLPPL